MTTTCGATHPTSERICGRQPGNHPTHSVFDLVLDTFIDWPNTEYVRTSPRRGSREQQDARTRKKLKDMADRTTEATRVKPTLYPSETDRLGRTALYLRKYKGKWVALDELELKTVAGAGAKLCLTTLINRYRWEIKAKVAAKEGRQFFMLVSE